MKTLHFCFFFSLVAHIDVPGILCMYAYMFLAGHACGLLQICHAVAVHCSHLEHLEYFNMRKLVIPSVIFLFFALYHQSFTMLGVDIFPFVGYRVNLFGCVLIVTILSLSKFADVNLQLLSDYMANDVYVIVVMCHQ